MKKEEFYDLLESIPKAELHVHEEAVLSRETVKKVYKRNFNQDMSDEEFNSLFEYDDLTGFLSSFIKIQSYFTNINDFEYMFKDFEDYSFTFPFASRKIMSVFRLFRVTLIRSAASSVGQKTIVFDILSVSFKYFVISAATSSILS